MHSEKKIVQIIHQLLLELGVNDVVLSPGSRNAPFIISFANEPKFNIFTITDERSAAFFANGISLKTKKPTVICCTSGSAPLNYAPAIAEAYYSGYPLIVITADRPSEWVHQYDGQTIDQNNIFQNFCKSSLSLQESDWSIAEEKIAELLFESITGFHGPVHLNIGFEEPLYNKSEEFTVKANFKNAKTEKKQDIEIEELIKIWTNSSRKLILCGANSPDDQLSNALNKINRDSGTIVLHETTSNLHIEENSISSIDQTLAAISHDEDYAPDLLITLGGQVVSKKVKAFLRDKNIKNHWHFAKQEYTIDTYRCLTAQIAEDPSLILSQLPTSSNSTFKENWLKVQRKGEEAHNRLIQEIPYSDLFVFKFLNEHLPNKCVVHLANSTPVRYAQLFNYSNKNISFYANRGTSGIDGSSSTGVGFAHYDERENFIITGDLSFFYDSNAFWNNYVSNHLKVILINNQGGGIFRFIPGPRSTNYLESIFENRHQCNAKGISETFNLKYYQADSETSINNEFHSFLRDKSASILEIFTPADVNDKVLKEYFASIKNSTRE